MKVKTVLGILTTVCAAALAYLWPTVIGAPGDPCLVATSQGGVLGVHLGQVCEFRSVPFGASTATAMRWKPPVSASPWAPAVLDATNPTPTVCAQFNQAGSPVGTEDCLKMQIWAPHSGTRPALPVIVWFHPGSFISASAAISAHNAARFVTENNAIVVAPNYRLGPFGFLAHEALRSDSSEYSSAGNYGLLDQRLALEWVRTHIADFGGDPNRITIAGQSAGGLSVSLHLVSPGSHGLFDRAIMQGGFASYRWRTREDGEAQADAFAVALGCAASLDVPACLREKTRDQVLQALPVGTEQYAETGRTQWGPVVDGLVIPDQPRTLFEAGAFSRVPMIIGSNDDEGWTWVNRSFTGIVTQEQYELALATEFGSDAVAILAAYPAADFDTPKDALARAVTDAEYACGAARLASLVERTNTRIHLYQFDYGVQAVASGRAVHGLDIHFLFGTNVTPPVGTYTLNDGADADLFKSMARLWTRFADKGNPNSDESVTEWPKFNRPSGAGQGADRYLILDAPMTVGKRLRAACAFWEPYFFRSITGEVPAAAP